MSFEFLFTVEIQIEEIEIISKFEYVHSCLKLNTELNLNSSFSARSVRAKIAMFSNGDLSLTRSLTQNDVRFEEKTGLISGVKAGSLTGTSLTGTERPAFGSRAALTRMSSAGETKMIPNSFGGGGRSQSLMEISNDFNSNNKRFSPTQQVRCLLEVPGFILHNVMK